MNLPFKPDDVSRRLLDWYGKEGRDLPWRTTRDPYRIWLSEIMLQQTTVAAVIPYYQRFLAKFPTVEILAKASLDAVIELWAGLGYYSRARNLHKAAQQVQTVHSGQFPATLEGLVGLPGIGRSTAGAILSIAFDKPAPILDGNVRRVLVRLFAWQENPRSSRAEKQLWNWAEVLTSQEQPHDYAQAIMDLGATVCTPQAPACPCCPLAELCRANAQSLADQLPVKQVKPKVPIRLEATLLLQNDTQLLVRQRPPEGLLGGLWEFPVVEFSGKQSPLSAARAFLVQLGQESELTEVGTLKHAYSHFKLVSTLFSARCPKARIGAEGGYVWRSRQDLEALPLHGAHRKGLDLFLQKSELNTAIDAKTD